MHGQQAGEGGAAEGELFSARHLAGRHALLGARRRRGNWNSARVSPDPARRAGPPGPPAADRGRAPYEQTARSMGARCLADRQANRGSRKPTRIGSARRRASARGGRWLDVNQSGGQIPQPDASVFPPPQDAPCREGLWQIRGERHRQTAPEPSIGFAHRSDDLVRLGQDVLKAMPTITLGLSRAVSRRRNRSTPARTISSRSRKRPDATASVANCSRSGGRVTPSITPL